MGLQEIVKISLIGKKIFFGMLLGVPVFAVIYYIVQQILDYRMNTKHLSTSTDEYVELYEIDEKTKEMKYNKKD